MGALPVPSLTLRHSVRRHLGNQVQTPASMSRRAEGPRNQVVSLEGGPEWKSKDRLSWPDMLGHAAKIAVGGRAS